MKIKYTIFLLIVLSITPLTLCLAQEDSWKSNGEIPLIRAFHASCRVDSIIYIIGGITANSFPNATPLVQAFDPIRDTFEDRAPMLTARLSLQTCVLGGKIYAMGGSERVDTPSLHSAVVEVYDPITDSWTTCESLPETRIYFGATVSNGRIYVIGGMFGVGIPCNTVYEYNPDLDSWTSKESMPTARNYISACCDSGKIYVFGGAVGISDSSLTLVEMYDPVTDTWDTKSDMLFGIQRTQTCNVDNKIYLMGCRRGLSGSEVLDLNHEYDPVQDSWTPRKEMPVPRVYHTITAFKDEVYVIGGTSDGDFTGAVLTIHVYTPSASSGINEKEDQSHPYSYELFQNYPNPFNPVTTICYTLPKSSNVTLTIFNLTGQEITTLVNKTQPAGEYEVIWNTGSLPSGVYVCRLQAGEFMQTRKMVLLR